LSSIQFVYNGIVVDFKGRKELVESGEKGLIKKKKKIKKEAVVFVHSLPLLER